MKKILFAIILLALFHSNAHARVENSRPLVALSLDFGRDSWGIEAGVKFDRHYTALGFSENNTEDAPSDYIPFEHRPVIYWTPLGKFNDMNEAEVYIKQGVFITKGICLEGALGYGWQDTVDIYLDTDTGLLWGKEQRNGKDFLTAHAGILYLIQKGYFKGITLRAGWHSRRGFIAGTGIMF